MQDINKALYEYCEAHSSPPLAILNEIERATHLHTLSPRMLSGHIQGLFLSMISMMKAPRKILEIGTFTGYSAICLARGLAKDGILYTLEYDPENAAMAEALISKSEFADHIRLMAGDAKTIIPELEDGFDLVFIDADKEGYAKYFDLVVPKCNSGAFILADNVLWSGKVTEPDMDKKTAIIDGFNKKVHEDPRVETVVLPLRDGISLMRVL